MSSKYWQKKHNGYGWLTLSQPIPLFIRFKTDNLFLVRVKGTVLESSSETTISGESTSSIWRLEFFLISCWKKMCKG